MTSMRFVRVLPLVGLLGLACDSNAAATVSGIGVDCVGLGVRVSPASVAMVIGDSAQLSAAAPTCGALPVPFAVSWTSSNAAVATVDSAGGKVRAVAAGQATIIASVIGDAPVKGAAVIQVNPR